MVPHRTRGAGSFAGLAMPSRYALQGRIRLTVDGSRAARKMFTLRHLEGLNGAKTTARYARMRKNTGSV